MRESDTSSLRVHSLLDVPHLIVLSYMNSLSLAIIIAFSISTSTSRGALVKEGSDIDAVNRAMEKAGYSKTGLQMGTLDPSYRLAFWSVDEGVLVVVYSNESKRVTNVSFCLSDERPRGTRKTFDLNVTSFDTDSGAMVVQTNPTKREQDGAGQPATRPESDSEGSDKPQPEAGGRSQ